MPKIITKLGQKKEWPSYFLPVLGILTAIGFFLLTIINIFNLLEYAQLLTHVGLFQVQHYPVVLWSLFAFIFIIYVFFYLFIISSNINKKIVKRIIIFSVIFMFILLISGPFMSADLYGYVYRVEMTNVLNINPYQVTPAEAGYGGVTPWNSGVMPYGPLFTIVSMGLNKISGAGMALNLFIFRIFNIVLFLVCAYIIFKIIKKINPDFAYKGAALFLWNPFILIEIINNGHNDILILLFVLLLIYFLLIKKFILATLMIIGGFLVKYVIILLLPIPFLMLLFNEEYSWKIKIKKILLSLLTIILVLIIFYLPFGTFGCSIGKTENFYNIYQKITFPTLLISRSVELIDKVFNFNVSTGALASILNIVIFLMVYFYFLLKRSYSKDYIVKQVFWIIFSFLFLLTFKINVWYLIWMIPLVLLVSNKRYYPLIIFFTGLGFMFYLLGFDIANILIFIATILYYLALYYIEKFNIKFSNNRII